MNTAYDYAKYFMSKGMDSFPNTFDGNMKLQKLLVFADLLSLAKYGSPLFDDKIMAFTNGYVVEDVRKEYQNNYAAFKAASDSFKPDFSDTEQIVMDYTEAIYGSMSAKELSDLSHDFDFWSESYNNGLSESGYHNKELSVISTDSMIREIGKVRNVIAAYEQTQQLESSFQYINGIRFYYTPSDLEMTDEIIGDLFEFSKSADESSYSVYYDNGELVVY